ncbi:MAG: PHB depolymerase family esterase [Microthrixaceae bacterium]
MASAEGTRRKGARRNRQAAVLAAMALLAAVACGDSIGANEVGSAAGGRAGHGRTQLASEVCPPEGRWRIDTEAGARWVELRVPQGAAAPLPAVVAVHGFGAQADRFLAESGIEQRSAAAGALVVAPQALGDPPRWEVLADFERDEAFITGVLDSLQADGCLDPGRVAMGGHSAGSALAAFYGCAHPERFTALVLNAGLPPPLCREATPNLVITHGIDDSVVPFGGGPQRVGESQVALPTVPDSAAVWATQGGCGKPTTIVEPPVTFTRWAGCASEATAVLGAIDGWGHAWPGSAASSGIDVGCVLAAAAVSGAPPSPPFSDCPAE